MNYDTLSGTISPNHIGRKTKRFLKGREERWVKVVVFKGLYDVMVMCGHKTKCLRWFTFGLRLGG